MALMSPEFYKDYRPKDWRELVLHLYPREENCRLPWWKEVLIWLKITKDPRQRRRPLSSLIAEMKAHPVSDKEFRWFK
jgi:hypothetical protein